MRERAADELAAGLGDVDLRVTQPRWWTVVKGLQFVLFAAMLAGILWLLGLVGLGWLRLDDIIPTPEVEGFALPTLLALGGALGGLLVALLSRLFNGAGARRRARRAQRALDARVAAVADERVVAPAQAELDARERLCDAVKTARPRR
jgi:hypothetical protein